MDRDEFTSLPPAIALGIVYDIAAKQLAGIEKPRLPGSPKFDSKLSRKGGMYVWVSEMLLDDIRYWHKRKSEETEGKYAEKSQKQARELAFWIKWRECYPTEVWRGERNRAPAVANPPSRDPEQHAWESRGATGATASTGTNFDDIDDVAPPAARRNTGAYDFSSDDDIPF